MNQFDDLVALDPVSLSETLVSQRPTVAELSKGEWLGVVELLTARLANEVLPVSTDRWLTYLGALAYALDSAVASGAIDQRECLIRRLNLAVALREQAPPSTGDATLDPSVLIDLLFEELPISAEQARDMSTNWRALDVAQIRTLRSVKNLMSPALALATALPAAEVDPRFKVWREVFPSLP
ncbi:hypothetical protein GCM10029976_018400 [Kribbella albertanoniae]|uniref:Uncharacterized protein n=1 Tax=Kribbella albertanoniae TaxID=1266829 RepID=A0A4R4PBR1_9ACTN|nr:hypothetical protein [Kribbella albertanoniae]TDC18530.1 hypothetical protein E1261_35320 [Kribbella albertanoniae]